MAGNWKKTSLRQAGVSLIDCDHRTPPAADGGYPYIAIPQLKDGRIDLSDVRRISHEHFVDWTRKAKPQQYDVILSRRCNPGETAYVPSGLYCALGQNLVLLRADGTKLFPPFLRWLVRGPDWWEQVGTFINVGAVFDSLKCADIPNFRMPLPPLVEQRAIADILGALDIKIELNRRTNETLERMARAIFQSWFVDFDPVRAKRDGLPAPALSPTTAALFPGSFEDSQLGKIPTGWNIGAISGVAEVVMGTSPSSDTYNESGTGTPLVNGPVEFGAYFPLKTKWTTEPTRFAEPGDLIFCVRGSTTGRRVISDDKYCLGRGVCAIRAKHGWQHFINQTVDVELPRMLSRATGSVFPSLGGPEMKEFQIVVPDPRIIDAFCLSVGPFQFKIANNVVQSLRLAAVRDALLPKLLSGEIRVAEVERLVEDSV